MSDKIRNQIITASRERFAHYGYGKTSMSEIAKDCEMSVGNLYRFFNNKEAIAAAGTEVCFIERAEQSEGAVDPSDSAIEQIATYMIERLRYMHRFVSESPHMHELVELISTRHQDLLQQFENRAIAYMASILDEGQRKGEVGAGSPVEMATNVYRAMTMFNMPLCMYGPLDEKELQLHSLLKTINSGLSAREGKL